jgi:hypothetical protein
LRKRQASETERSHKATEDRSKYRYLGPAADGSGSVFLDESTGKTRIDPIGVTPKGAATKPLPSAAIKSLTEAGSTYADFDRLVSTYRPD